ncbi:metallophosphoesterase family protein [Bacteroidota bacterium]
MNRVAVISDIHGNLIALEEVVRDIESRKVNRVFNLGDHVSGPLWPKETLELLKQQNWIHIQGNHERQLVEQEVGTHNLSDSYAYQNLKEEDLKWLSSLPTDYTYENEFYLFHGTPSNDSVYLLETVAIGVTRLATQSEITERLGKIDSKVLLCGHTHIPRVVEIGDHLIVNPGSVGLQAYDDVLPEYHKIEVGSSHARYAILEKKDGDWYAEIIAVPYDYNKAADRATKNNRPDWEVGIRTGFMNN